MTRSPAPGSHLYEHFHVRLGSRRTTVSIDRTLHLLMSLHLGVQPHSRAAHLAVRDWLQQHLDRHGDPQRAYVSHWLRGEIAEALIGPALKRKYDEWLDSELHQNRSPQAISFDERDRSL